MRVTTLFILGLLAFSARSASASPRRVRDAMRPCVPPPDIDVTRMKPPRPRTRAPRAPAEKKLMHIDAAGDLETCRVALRTAGICLSGEIVVIEVGDAILRTGRCERDPPDTEAYGFRNEGFYRPIEKVPELPGYEDRFQTYVYWTDFKQGYRSRVPVEECQSCPMAYHLSLFHPEGGGREQINNIEGIGRPFRPYEESPLHAIINMWSINDWKEEELVDQTRFNPPAILAHETEHDVCCYLAFIGDDRRVSMDLIGAQGAHWSYYHNTYGQLMYGGNWREEGNGTFYSIGAAHGTRPLDLYLWGLIPAEQVPPVFVVDTSSEPCEPSEQTLEALKVDCADYVLDRTTDLTCADDFERCLEKFDLCLDPPYYRSSGSSCLTDAGGGCAPYDAEVTHSPTGIRAKGRKKMVTMEQILKAQPPRKPDYKSSYKVNTQLFVLFVKDAAGLKQETLDRMNSVRRAASRKLYDVTGHRLRNVNTWDGRVDSPYWHWGGVPEWDGDAELEGWKRLGAGPPLEVQDGGLVLRPGGGAAAAMVHDNVRIRGEHFDALQVIMRVPLRRDEQGLPKLLFGKFVLEGARTVEIPFPVAADGKLHEITVHPDHELIAKAKCSGCVALCRNADEDDEGWYDSCAGEVPTAKGVLRAGECRTDLGLTACGPYCYGQGTEAEGWYDSCASKLAGDVYTKLTVVPVTGAEGAKVGTIWIDSVDLFVTAQKVEEGDKKKNGEKDDDGDGLINAFDNCPTVANPRQMDANDDGEGDACGDFDADGVYNALDNCPDVVNSLQQDGDHDGVGDACDPDHDPDACGIGGVSAQTALLPLLCGLGCWLLLLRRRRRRTDCRSSED